MIIGRRFLVKINANIVTPRSPPRSRGGGEDDVGTRWAATPSWIFHRKNIHETRE